MPSDAASDASARSEVPLIAAQKARFLGAVALDFVDPDEPHEVATGRELRPVDDGPTAVALMIVDLGSLSAEPARRVRGHGLLSSFRGVGSRCGRKSASGGFA
eukprot:3629748-Pleurochrysis_carterae.AAC.1